MPIVVDEMTQTGGDATTAAPGMQAASVRPAPERAAKAPFREQRDSTRMANGGDFSMRAVLAAHETRKALLDASASPYRHGIAWVEGMLCPLHDARVPILDQGFLRCDLTYDVPAVWDGRFFRLDDHLDRLDASCEKLRLRIPMDRKTLRETLVDMVAKTGIRDAYVELIVTRGLKFVREYKSYENTVYLMVMPYVWVMPPQFHPTGGSAIVTRTVRKERPLLR